MFLFQLFRNGSASDPTWEGGSNPSEEKQQQQQQQQPQQQF